MATAILQELHSQLQWPEPERVLNPPGGGPAAYQRLARLKIEAPLVGKMGKDQVRVGVLVGDPDSDASDAPIALVCDFKRALSPEYLKQTRNLAWNFCRTPLLITLEPQLIRAWSCYERPDKDTGEFPSETVGPVCKINGTPDLSCLADTLHWVQLASGQFLARNSHRFKRDQAADVLLLQNLRYIRDKLTTYLDESIAHDWLARVVFVQFLMDRKDRQGKAALSKEKRTDLYRQGILSQLHDNLASILKQKQDTFALFEWLNKPFNGDLFPGKISPNERDAVEPCLEMLADFVSGKLEMEKGQYLLWQHYSFDTIPLEFISSIYEEFVTKRKNGERGIGEHYTRPFLVDFMLDKVLPWSGTEWDLKILDPCCGSAVFLVKAFQRLVQRWRNANGNNANPSVEFLRDLFEKNLFGVDINPNAVRVASFSLYLAMCDEIDPKEYWDRDGLFPSLRGERIRDAGFFSEDVEGIRTQEDAERYDLVIGNAPWGDVPDEKTEEGRRALAEREKAEKWARNEKDGPWPLADKQTGTLFLVKAARLCKPDGRVCMIQPAGALLFNISKTANKFREKFFTRYKVDEIVNLSALRFAGLFANAVGPACIINMRPIPPDGNAIAYWTPKRSHTGEEQVRVVLDEQDLNWVWPDEAACNPIVWPALMWGGRRDLNSINRIRSGVTTLRQLEQTKGWHVYSGFKRVPKSAAEYPERIGIPCLENHEDFWNAPYLVDASVFPKNDDPMFERPHDLNTFALPLLIVSRSRKGNFKAVLVKRTETETHLLYSESFFAISAPKEDSLRWMASFINTPFCLYYLYLTSGRLASYRPTVRKEDLRLLPFKEDDRKSDLGDVPNLNLIEKALLDDFSRVVLPDFNACEGQDAPGRCAVRFEKSATCARLETYADWVLRVLESTFGPDKDICATIFRSPNANSSPFCMVGIHLDWKRSERIRYEDVTDGDLLSVLKRCVQNNTPSSAALPTEAIYYQRVFRTCQSLPIRVGRKRRNVPTVFLIKPNQVRYWTRSAALRDADNVVADIMTVDSPAEAQRG
jgi:hypothetical protein